MRYRRASQFSNQGGVATMAGKVTRSLEERFWEKVSVTADCWEWTAKKTPKGYGRIWYNGKNIRAHCMSWILLYGGYDRQKLCVLHHCDNPSCVRPEHLFLGTHADNIRDRDAKDRTARGEQGGNRKLTEAQVIAIRSSDGSLSDIAVRFNIDRTQVWHIKTRQQWKHI